MADRNVIVRLKAEIADFERGMDEAAKAAEQVGKASEGAAKSTKAVGSAAEDAGKKAAAAAAASRKEWTQWWPEVQKGDGIMKELGKSFRENRAEWDKLAGGMLKAGGAMTAVTAGVLATGVAYNTLQQTSRAALTTMMGGAEAANAQMDKLDEFARTSPFAKTTFINAQRQLIGFGMEAERVIPTLDAIQNAVAAMGGSNQDIAELSFIIAQVGAAGKITATDLMQFGQRGVDAATIIGSQMGKTGAQIRDEITAGTLDADEAIDALVAGMQEKFGGAAAGVKDTFSGAVDRVKAAIRDLSSEFATFLVNPQGGGALIDWTNKFADLLRAVQKLPDPVKKTGGAVFAFSGVALLAAGSAIKLAGAYMDMLDTVKKLGTEMPRLHSAIGGVGTWAAVAGAVAGVGFAFGALHDAVLPATAGVEELQAALISLTQGSATDLNRILYDLGEQAGWTRVLMGQVALDVNDLGEALNRIDNKSTLDWFSDLNDGVQRFFGMTPEVDQARAVFDRLGETLVKTANEAGAEKAAEQFAALVDELGGGEEAVDRLLAVMPAYAAYLKETENQTKLTSSGVSALAQAQQDAADAAERASEAQDTYANAVLAATRAVLAAANSQIGYEDAIAKATKAAKENGKTLDITTEKGRANKTELLNVAAAALRVAEDNLKAGDSVDSVGKSMEAARKQFIDTAKSMGASSAEAEKMADQYGLTRDQVDHLKRSMDEIPDVVKTRIEAETAKAISDIKALQSQIDGIRGRTVVIATTFSGPGASMVRSGQVGLFASGGLLDKTRLGMVKQYASGGFFDGAIGAQQPQVRPYGGPRGLLWSEEGSGPWEAFISGHPAKRDRSLRIWMDVGRRLGAIAAHADGGTQEYARAVRYAGPTAPALSAPARLDPRDIDLLAERIGRGVERGAYRGVAEIGRGL